MGLFSSKKKIFVSSVAYNMAGDELERPNYLKTLVLGNVIGNSNVSIADTINGGYIRGPGIKFRNFFRWAEDNYDYIGMPTAKVNGIPELDREVLREEVPHDVDESINLQSAEISLADHSYWAEQYMLANHPDLIETDWTTDYLEDTGEILITFEDTTTYSFVPDDFDKDATYLYVGYNTSVGLGDGDLVPGSEVIVPDGDPFPDITGWTLVSEVVGAEIPVTLEVTVQTHIVYTDGSPTFDDTETTETDSSYEETVRVYSKKFFLGNVGTDDEVASELRIYTFTESSIIDQDVDVVVNTDPDFVETITTTTDIIVPQRKYVLDTQEVDKKLWGPLAIYIYKIGSGNSALDSLVQITTDSGEFFPFIPVRLDNNFLSDSFEPDGYDLAKRAYKKAMNGKFDLLIENLEDNESLEDIDYAYVVFGVSMNVLENSSKKYLYNFFHRLMGQQSSGNTEYALWQVQQGTFQTINEEWNVWRLAQDDTGNPLYGSEEPVQGQFPGVPQTSIRIKSNGDLDTDFDMEISWVSISETTGTGLLKPDAKNNEVWFDVDPTDEYEQTVYSNKSVKEKDTLLVDQVKLNWQIDENSWKSLSITGMVHRNYIYGGKYVEIGMKEAIEDDEESGFIVPIHYPTYREMSLVDTTQMSTACCFIVFNCYIVKKIKWYQKGIFKIILVVIIAVVASVIFTPAGGAAAGAAAGSIGAAAATAIGLTGLIAVIAAAVVNTLVAMILIKVLTAGATVVFGKKLGMIIGTIAAVIALQVGTAFATGANMSTMFAQLTSAQNIMALTSAVGNGVAQYTAMSAAEWSKKAELLVTEYEKESKRISQLYAENIGYGTGVFDPMMLVDSANTYIESEAEFLTRTLMTGSDIAEMSIGMLSDFAALTLRTDLPSS